MTRGIITAIAMVLGAGGLAFIKASYDIFRRGKQDDKEEGGK